MKKVLIVLLTLVSTYTFAKDEAGKQAFTSLQAAARPDRQAFVDSYISYDELQNFIQTAELKEEIKQWLKEVERTEIEEKMLDQYEYLSEKLSGKVLQLDKTACKDKIEKEFKLLTCEVRFFIEEFAFNIEVGIFPLKDKYKTIWIGRLNQEPTQAEIDAEKSALKSYESLLTTDKTLTQGYEEYIELFKKDFGEDALKLKVGQKANDDDINTLAKRLNTTVPDELASFYKNYGNGVTIQDDSTNDMGLHFFSTDKVMGIIEFIKQYGANPDIDASEVDEFNDKLFVFAFDGEPQDRHIFMFDKAGNIYGFDYFDEGYDNPLDFIPSLTHIKSLDKKMNTFINQRKLEFIYSIELNQDVPEELRVEFYDIF